MENAEIKTAVSKSELIRRCTALLLILTGLALGHLGWELTHDRNWMEAVEKIYYAAITLLTTLMLPYK